MDTVLEHTAMDTTIDILRLKPFFLGFLVKEYFPAPAWEPPITEVCSAGDCIASRPPGSLNLWDFNRGSCWNDEASALAGVPAGEQANYRLYAYRAFPLVFDTSGLPEQVSPDEMFFTDLPPLPPEPNLSQYEHLGYDIVQYAGYLNYGCSPLSCNGMASEYPTNQFCLLDSLETAYQAAIAFGIDQPEPGSYIIMEILRVMKLEHPLIVQCV
jgi:hypothetical protein